MWHFVHFDLEMCFVPQRSALFRHLNVQEWTENAVFCTFWLGNVLRATTACTFSTPQLPKVDWECCVLYNSVRFFDISTSKSGPKLRCFAHFWLGNVLCATTACTFSASYFPKVVRIGNFSTLLTWKCASRHNGGHFFGISTSKSGPKLRCFVHFDLEMCFVPQRRAIFHLSSVASWLRTRRFSKPTFRLSWATNRWTKTQWIATCLPFRTTASSFFSLFLFSDLLTSFLLLSDSSHLCFSNCPYCRKFHF